MDRFKIALDKYLTTPPDDVWTDYIEMVVEHLTQEFFDSNESWVNDDDGEFIDLCERLMVKGGPAKVAKIIERYKRFKKK